MPDGFLAFSHRKPQRLRFTLTAGLVVLCIALSGCNLKDPGRRTPGAAFDDQVLQRIVKRQIRRSDEAFKGSHIEVTSYNGVVLLAGQVGTEDLKNKASVVAEDIHKVRKIHNELTIGGPTSLVSRSNDSWLSTKVKTRLTAAKKVKANKIKVKTENGVVYLMGLLTHDQADDAVDVAKNVYGVQKIVKVFEYLD